MYDIDVSMMPLVRVSPILLLALKRIASNSPLPFGRCPNVFGGADVSATSNKSAQPTGAFYETAVVENISTQQVNSQTDNMVVPAFDASRCSPIYKSTSKVQIRSCYALMIIKS